MYWESPSSPSNLAFTMLWKARGSCRDEQVAHPEYTDSSLSKKLVDNVHILQIADLDRTHTHRQAHT